MKPRPLTLLTLSAALLALSPALAAAPDANSLIIVNSGSTNMAGYRMEVLPNGNMAYASGGNIRSAALPAALTRKLFSDARAALPFAQMGLKPCMKSASFGSTTVLTYKNETSTDISCPGGPKAAALYGDVQAVRQAAGISLLPRRRFPAPFTGRKN
jgi:hypothetical protein